MTVLTTEQEHFSSFAEASPMPTAVYTGKDMIITTANQGMLDLWGKDRTVIGKKLAEVLPELHEQPFLNLLTEVFNTGISYHAKEDKADLLIDNKLQTFYYTFTYKALTDSKGISTGIIHTAVDITEIVEARKKLAETQEHLSFALLSAEIGIWDLDPIHNIVRWDARCRELFGFMEENQVVYDDVLSCIHPADQKRVNEAVLKAINPKTDGLYEVRYRTVGKGDNQIRWVHCKGKAYFNQDRVAYRFAGTVQDVTNEVNARRREQQLLSLVNYNADNMSVADMNGQLIYMNQASKDMLGVSDSIDITTLSAHNFYLPEELKRVQSEIIPKVLKDKGWQGTVQLLNQKTRELIPCLVNFILVIDPETNEIIGRGATARDLRPEIKAKAELQRLATIVDISEDFCNYCDIKGNTIYINHAGSELIGMDKNLIPETNMYDYHSVSSSEMIQQEIMPQLLDTGRWTGTLELIHQQTGEVIPIHKQLFIIRESLTNQPIAFAGIARDLRPELKSRKELQEKNTALHHVVKELEFLANSVPAVVWTSTPEGQLDYINDRWYERGSSAIKDSMGEGWNKNVHPDDRQAAWQAWNHAVKTGNPYEIEFRLMDKFGEYRWWLVRALPLKDIDGNIIKWYGTNTDISTQKELERQKDNFLGVASHELKTPVTSIKAYVQVMEKMFRRAGDIKNAELLAKMDNQVNKLTHLIADLLEVTKINTGRLPFNYTTFDFNQMVEEVTEEVQRTCDKHQIETQLNFKREFEGDRERICQVVTNLLTNAIKYSPDADRIIIYTEDHGHEVQLCVQDFGIGISSNKLDKVFEQFYRISGTTQHTFPGLGLGLYISAEIVKHLNGRIWVNSTEGEGSVFCFTLPVKN